uniref:Tonsoku-like protein n=1 Tax=Scophthalmus maximus TaxID=52904 RepID=A0A8D3DNV6_SCOMX
MSSSREMKQLQKAKSKAQNSSNLKEEASICNQLGELLSRHGERFPSAIREHQQELTLSEALNDVIGRAVANRKIGECYAEMGNIEAALKQWHLDLARSVRDHAEEQRALATIGRTYLFRYESDQSRKSLEKAEDAFRKSLSIVDDRLEGMVPRREISEMKARLFLNLGLVCDHLGEPKRCSEFIRRSVFIAEYEDLLEDLYRANYNLGNIYFRNGQHSNSVRCLEQAKECARKIKDKFSESECFHCIGKVQLSLGDFVAARRSLKKALLLGSQQPLDRQTVKKAFKYADQGCKLEDELGEDQGSRLSSHQAVELAEQLGDLYCKIGCYSKALDAYHAQLKGAEALGKAARELAVIHVSLAATYTDLRQHDRAVEHYRQELALRQGSSSEVFTTKLHIHPTCQSSSATVTGHYGALCYGLCQRPFEVWMISSLSLLQKRVLRLWLASQRRRGSSDADDTEARLQELCAAEGWSPEGSDGEEDEDEEMDNSESLEDSDVILSDSGRLGAVDSPALSWGWNKRNEKGETSLHRACIDGNLKQVQYLVEQGHPVNPRDYCGWTPLHEASNHGHYDIVAVLLEHGANVNDPGGPLCEGVTPLHDALACGNLQVARLLVERGASVTQRNSKVCNQNQHLQPLFIQRPFSTALKKTPHYKNSICSDDSDSDSPVSPLRPVRPRHSFPAASSQNEVPPNKETSSVPASVGVREEPAPSVFARQEYHSAIRGLGSAKSQLQGLSQPQFSSTPAVSSSNKSALVPEEEYLADDWLDDDLGEIQPKKKRRLRVEQNGINTCELQTCATDSNERSQESKKMVWIFYFSVCIFQPQAQTLAAPMPTSLPPPIRMRVRVQEDVFLIPVPQRLVSWLCEQAAQRYYQKCGLLPRLSLQKEGALLSPQDLLLAVLHTNEEVLAEVCSWDLPPLPERYKKACISLAVGEQHALHAQNSSVSVCGLSLAPSSLNPLLRALKLQASLTELRISGNRLHDNLLPELIATTVTMPRLRLLDISANHITGEGLGKAVNALKGQSHPAFPCLEELDLSLNPLGDGVSESLSCLLSCCPLLAKLSLQACGLTARFLQQHRLLLASALTGMGHLKSVCLAHNALGSTGFELVLKTLPLHCLTHLDLSAVRRGPADFPALEHLAKVLSQDDCSLTHLSLAANGLTDSSVATLARCLPSCPSLLSLNLSGNSSLTSAGLHSILNSLMEASRPLTLLNLQGCPVSGPWDSAGLDGLPELVKDLRLCSQGLNKLDRQALKQRWENSQPPGHFVDRKAKCLLSAAASS